jgi:Rps23 Pro-64 3,4-dihydroxylase Tpa1-like proline 4-hydroxylase
MKENDSEYSKHIKNDLTKDEVYLKNFIKIGNSPKNIHFINNVLSEEEHIKLLEFAKNNNNKWTVQPWGAKFLEHENLPEDILQMLEKVFKIAYDKCIEFYDIKLSPFDKYLFSLVKFDDGYKMGRHVDDLSLEWLHIAVIYYINDDYDGGEISFIDHNIKIKPKHNSLVIFPGNKNYMHEVLQVIGNDRYSSTLWFQFADSASGIRKPNRNLKNKN